MRVTLTLSTAALQGFGAPLVERGWQVRERPLLRRIDQERWTALDQALTSRQRFSALAFTSPRAAAAVAARMAALRIPPDTMPEAWAVGPQTAASLPPGIVVRVPSPPGGGRELAEAMLTGGVGGTVLHCTGQERREELGSRLRAEGVLVEEVVCYAMRMASDAAIVEALEGTDLIVIGSHRLIERAAPLRGEGGPGLVCLGPATAATARATGWIPVAVAIEPTGAGVALAIDALTAVGQGPRSRGGSSSG